MMQKKHDLRVRVIDSHTGGEPTRAVISGGPDLGNGSMAEQLALFRAKYDDFRSAVVNEPRGSDAVVGALLCQPADPACTAGVIFFNNVGYLGMCGHGTIGLVATLAYLGRIQPGEHRIETPVGVVSARLHANGSVSVANIPSRRARKDVTVEVPGIGTVTGDVAWGGNWFFLVESHGQALTFDRLDALTDYTWRVRAALDVTGIRGDDGHDIDHIELFDHSPQSGVNSRNFVLCPGRAYDRSSCGTGTSAKMACLVADGKLHEGDVWRQESIVGSVFEGSVRVADGVVHPTITGSAYICADATLIFDPRDPFKNGIQGTWYPGKPA